MKNRELKEMARKAVGLDNDEKTLDEAYVAQPKNFNIKTNSLSTVTKTAHDELYKGYVASFNELSAELDGADRMSSNSRDSEFRALKRDEAYNTNAAYLHELYFANIGDTDSKLYTDSIASMRIARDFGTIERWQEDFVACAVAAREGWAMLCFNAYLKRYVNVIVDGHDVGVPIGCFPVIVVDMWSHAYYNDFQNQPGKYVRKMMGELDWRTIEERFLKTEAILNALG